MKLREKTQRKFIDFFEKAARMHHGEPFELAFADIQRETGTASVTLKRAIQTLITDEILQVEPGRNSRYGRFRFLPYEGSTGAEQLTNSGSGSSDAGSAAENSFDEDAWEQAQTGAAASNARRTHHQAEPENVTPAGQESNALVSLRADVEELTHLTSHLWRRVRHQEMTIALLQDRLAELEDKSYKR